MIVARRFKGVLELLKKPCSPSKGAYTTESLDENTNENGLLKSRGIVGDA